MLSARDQENLIHGHQQAALSKPLNQTTRNLPPKTPSNKYPKTPLKVPLHDENAPGGFGGKSVLGTKGKGVENLAKGAKNGTTFDKKAFVTPMGPRTRAPLGVKTTNAKTKVFQTPAHLENDKEAEKQQKQASVRRQKPKVSHADPIKLSVHEDEQGPLEERDVEYAPPCPKYPSYESEDFPAGSLNYKMLDGPNLMRGFNKYYSNPVDENGVSLKERRFDEDLQRTFRDTDEQILKALEEDEWSTSDNSETLIAVHNDRCAQSKSSSNLARIGPATVTSRRAASALSVLPKARTSGFRTSKPEPSTKTPTSLLGRPKKTTPAAVPNTFNMRHTVATAASRSTLGYNKGRTASNALGIRSRGLTRSASQASNGSDATITPARYAEKGCLDGKRQEWKRLQFLGAFDVDDADIEPTLKGGLPECLRRDEDAEEEFVLELGGM